MHYLMAFTFEFFSDEDEEKGFTIQQKDFGLRLKALQYRKCTETNVFQHSIPQNEIKIVIAEPLPGTGALSVLSSHQSFLISFLFTQRNIFIHLVLGVVDIHKI